MLQDCLLSMFHDASETSDGTAPSKCYEWKSDEHSVKPRLQCFTCCTSPFLHTLTFAHEIHPPTQFEPENNKIKKAHEYFLTADQFQTSTHAAKLLNV